MKRTFPSYRERAARRVVAAGFPHRCSTTRCGSGSSRLDWFGVSWKSSGGRMIFSAAATATPKHRELAANVPKAGSAGLAGDAVYRGRADRVDAGHGGEICRADALPGRAVELVDSA